MVRAEEFFKMAMIQKCWSYAQHLGGVDPMLGVLHVIKNRIDAGWGTCGHVLETMEKWEAAPPVTTKHPDLWDRRFQMILGQIDAIWDGTHRPDVSNGAVYFGDTTEYYESVVPRTRCPKPAENALRDTGSWTYWSNLVWGGSRSACKHRLGD